MAATFLRGSTHWARIPRLTGGSTQRSLGTTDASTAKRIGQFVDWCVGSHQQWLLAAMADGHVPVLNAYTAYLELRLPAFIADAQGGDSDPDLEPYIDRWIAEMGRVNKPSAVVRKKYVAQVRTFIPAGATFRRSTLKRPAIRAWLQGLGIGQPNRYRAALSAFCAFLVVEEVLEFNPVAAVPATKEADPRTRHLTPAEAEIVVQALPSARDRALQALLICTAADVESGLAVTFRDVDRGARTVHIRGTKKAWRDRTCYVYDRWTALWDTYVESYLRANPGLPAAAVFPGPEYDGTWKIFKRSMEEAGIVDYTMKDHRHTWAVQAFRDQLPLHAISGQLGHRDPVMALKVYGKYVPRAADFRRGAAPQAGLEIANG